MSRARRRGASSGLGVSVSVLVALGCGERAASEVAVGSLPPGVVARVGAELVQASSVSRVSRAQGVTPRAALELAVSDAVFAQAAREELPATLVRVLERTAAARALLEQLQADAERAGPPTAAELGEVARERWAELDRPDAVRTTHAVVMNDQPGRDAAARAVAQALAAALAHVKSSEELIEVAGRFPGQGFEIRAEGLPFVTADGRVLLRRDAGFVAQRASFDPDFARAANALSAPGELSGVVKSAFGYHLIRLDERAPGVTVPSPELPGLLEPDVKQRRAKRARRELLERLRKAANVQVDRATDELTAQVKVAP